MIQMANDHNYKIIRYFKITEIEDVDTIGSIIIYYLGGLYSYLS